MRRVLFLSMDELVKEQSETDRAKRDSAPLRQSMIEDGCWSVAEASWRDESIDKEQFDLIVVREVCLFVGRAWVSVTTGKQIDLGLHERL